MLQTKQITKKENNLRLDPRKFSDIKKFTDEPFENGVSNFNAKDYSNLPLGISISNLLNKTPFTKRDPVIIDPKKSIASQLFAGKILESLQKEVTGGVATILENLKKRLNKKLLKYESEILTDGGQLTQYTRKPITYNGVSVSFRSSETGESLLLDKETGLLIVKLLRSCSGMSRDFQEQFTMRILGILKQHKLKMIISLPEGGGIVILGGHNCITNGTRIEEINEEQIVSENENASEDDDNEENQDVSYSDAQEEDIEEEDDGIIDNDHLVNEVSVHDNDPEPLSESASDNENDPNYLDGQSSDADTTASEGNIDNNEDDLQQDINNHEGQNEPDVVDQDSDNPDDDNLTDVDNETGDIQHTDIDAEDHQESVTYNGNLAEDYVNDGDTQQNNNNFIADIEDLEVSVIDNNGGSRITQITEVNVDNHEEQIVDDSDNGSIIRHEDSLDDELTNEIMGNNNGVLDDHVDFDHDTYIHSEDIHLNDHVSEDDGNLTHPDHQGDASGSDEDEYSTNDDGLDGKPVTLPISNQPQIDDGSQDHEEEAVNVPTASVTQTESVSDSEGDEDHESGFETVPSDGVEEGESVVADDDDFNEYDSYSFEEYEDLADNNLVSPALLDLKTYIESENEENLVHPVQSLNGDHDQNDKSGDMEQDYDADDNYDSDSFEVSENDNNESVAEEIEEDLDVEEDPDVVNYIEDKSEEYPINLVQNIKIDQNEIGEQPDIQNTAQVNQDISMLQNGPNSSSSHIETLPHDDDDIDLFLRNDVDILVQTHNDNELMQQLDNHNHIELGSDIDHNEHIAQFSELVLDNIPFEHIDHNVPNGHELHQSQRSLNDLSQANIHAREHDEQPSGLSSATIDDNLLIDETIEYELSGQNVHNALAAADIGNNEPAVLINQSVPSGLSLNNGPIEQSVAIGLSIDNIVNDVEHKDSGDHILQEYQEYLIEQNQSTVHASEQNEPENKDKDSSVAFPENTAKSKVKGFKKMSQRQQKAALRAKNNLLETKPEIKPKPVTVKENKKEIAVIEEDLGEPEIPVSIYDGFRNANLDNPINFSGLAISKAERRRLKKKLKFEVEHEKKGETAPNVCEISPIETDKALRDEKILYKKPVNNNTGKHKNKKQTVPKPAEKLDLRFKGPVVSDVEEKDIQDQRQVVDRQVVNLKEVEDQMQQEDVKTKNIMDANDIKEQIHGIFDVIIDDNDINQEQKYDDDSLENFVDVNAKEQNIANNSDTVIQEQQSSEINEVLDLNGADMHEIHQQEEKEEEGESKSDDDTATRLFINDQYRLQYHDDETDGSNELNNTHGSQQENPEPVVLIGTNELQQEDEDDVSSNETGNQEQQQHIEQEEESDIDDPQEHHQESNSIPIREPVNIDDRTVLSEDFFNRLNLINSAKLQLQQQKQHEEQEYQGANNISDDDIEDERIENNHFILDNRDDVHDNPITDSQNFDQSNLYDSASNSHEESENDSADDFSLSSLIESDSDDYSDIESANELESEDESSILNSAGQILGNVFNNVSSVYNSAYNGIYNTASNAYTGTRKHVSKVYTDACKNVSNTYTDSCNSVSNTYTYVRNNLMAAIVPKPSVTLDNSNDGIRASSDDDNSNDSYYQREVNSELSDDQEIDEEPVNPENSSSVVPNNDNDDDNSNFPFMYYPDLTEINEGNLDDSIQRNQNQSNTSEVVNLQRQQEQQVQNDGDNSNVPPQSQPHSEEEQNVQANSAVRTEEQSTEQVDPNLQNNQTQKQSGFEEIETDLESLSNIEESLDSESTSDSDDSESISSSEDLGNSSGSDSDTTINPIIDYNVRMIYPEDPKKKTRPVVPIPPNPKIDNTDAKNEPKINTSNGPTGRKTSIPLNLSNSSKSNDNKNYWTAWKIFMVSVFVLAVSGFVAVGFIHIFMKPPQEDFLADLEGNEIIEL